MSEKNLNGRPRAYSAIVKYCSLQKYSISGSTGTCKKKPGMLHFRGLVMVFKMILEAC